MKIIAQNKKAYHDYEVLDTLEAGIVLTGDEVKSIRAGKVSLIGSYATFKDGELFLLNANITPYEKAYLKEEDTARRSRKLLLHKKELMRLIGQIAKKGITLVPLKLYFTEKSNIKVAIGICRHKKAPSKKAELRERDIKRQTAREIKGRR